MKISLKQSKGHLVEPDIASSSEKTTPNNGKEKEDQATVAVCPTAEELQQKRGGDRARKECPVRGCNFTSFSSSKDLQSHITVFHPNLADTYKESGVVPHFHCPHPGCMYHVNLGRWFASLKQLRYHFTNTHDVKLFACGKCSKRFGLERDRDHHQRECDKTFSCRSCASNYPSRSALLTHCYRKRHPVPTEFQKTEKQKMIPLTTATTATTVAPTISTAKSGPRTILPKPTTSLTSTMAAFIFCRGVPASSDRPQNAKAKEASPVSTSGGNADKVSFGGVVHSLSASQPRSLTSKGTPVPTMGGKVHVPASERLSHFHGSTLHGENISPLGTNADIDRRHQSNQNCDALNISQVSRPECVSYDSHSRVDNRLSINCLGNQNPRQGLSTIDASQISIKPVQRLSSSFERGLERNNATNTSVVKSLALSPVSSVKNQADLKTVDVSRLTNMGIQTASLGSVNAPQLTDMAIQTCKPGNLNASKITDIAIQTSRLSDAVQITNIGIQTSNSGSLESSQ